MEKSEKLQNWKNINIEKITENLDYNKIHELQVFSDYNDSIIIWADGEISVIGSNSTPNTDEWYAVIKAWGRGNIVVDDYADGWAERETDEDGDYTDNWIETKTGRVMTESDMISECIKEGDWDDHYSHLVDRITEQYENDIQNLEDMINQNSY